jgi:hypothetical protein
MTRAIAAGLTMAVLLAGTAQAEPITYSWTGMGVGSGKCATYKMTIDVTVDGNSVKALFEQEGRPQRHFEAVKDAKGAFKAKAEVGGGGSMDVTGSVADADPKVVLDGYCKFGGKLTKK